MLALKIIWLFLLWTIFWSFWSVLITRLQENIDRKTIKWILFWFSHCPNCKTRLKARNLIPIVSFFLQKGKCENCKKEIPVFYPIIEILSGVIFVATYLLVYYNLAYILPNDIQLMHFVFWTLMNRLLLMLIIYDFQKFELHMPIRIKAVLISLIAQFFGRFGDYQRAFLGSLIFCGVFLGIYSLAKRYVKKKYKQDTEWFWQWDIFAGFLLGTLLPFIFEYNNINPSMVNLSKIFIILMIISSTLWIVWYIIAWILEKKNILHISKPEDQKKFKIIPFIPFLIISFWILLYTGNFLLRLIFN